MDVTQVRRLLRLTLLAPEVVERLVGSSEAALEQVMRRRWPLAWPDQVQGLSHVGRDAEGCLSGQRAGRVACDGQQGALGKTLELPRTDG